MSSADKFFARVDKFTNGCWVWKGQVVQNRTGVMHFQGRRRAARNVAWFLAYGEFPERTLTSKCGNKMCVSPIHAAEGLLPSDYDTIKKLHSLGFTQRQIGEKFGVGREAISLFLSRRESLKESFSKIKELYASRS